MTYSIVKVFCKLYYALFFRFKVEGVENVPLTGSAILCSNHISNFDPVTIALAIPRLPRYMAKKELFKVPVLGWLITKLHAFPVDRSTADMAAFKKAVQVLKGGELVGMFAQGTRVKPGEEKAAKASVALFAMKGNAPVIPVAIHGNMKPFSKVAITFGEPLTLDEYRGKRLNSEALDEITEIIMTSIKNTLAQEAGE